MSCLNTVNSFSQMMILVGILVNRKTHQGTDQKNDNYNQYNVSYRNYSNEITRKTITYDQMEEQELL